jgi:hypothetical protein
MTAALDAMLRWICRAAIGLTLALAAATPSFAEVGCFEEAVKHSQELTASGGDAVAQAPVEGDEGPQSDRPSHCAFGHCAQWVPAALPGRATSSHAIVGRLYPPFLVHRRDQSARDGPERPPRT